MKKYRETQAPLFTWKQLVYSVAFLIVLAPVFLYGYYRNNQRKAIREAPQLVTGTVTRFVRSGNGKRNWYDAYADYRVKDRVYTCVGRATIGLTKAQRDSLIGVRLPVIYEQADPTNAHLLAGTQAFSRFNFDVPDTLSWTKLYFKH